VTSNDRDYRAIVYALFMNQTEPPGEWIWGLQICGDDEIAIKALIGKIASK
jgi:hypothetical protein